jgi:hypothetical protein
LVIGFSIMARVAAALSRAFNNEYDVEIIDSTKMEAKPSARRVEIRIEVK